MAVSKRRFRFRLISVLLFTMLVSIPIAFLAKVKREGDLEDHLIEQLELLHPESKSLGLFKDPYGLLIQSGFYPYQFEKDWDRDGPFAWDKYVTRVRFLAVSSHKFHPEAWEIAEQFPRLEQVLIYGTDAHSIDLDEIRARLPNAHVAFIDPGLHVTYEDDLFD